MKKIIPLLLVFSVVLSLLVSCGPGEDQENENGNVIQGDESDWYYGLDLKKEQINIVISDSKTSPYCGVAKYGTRYMVGPDQIGSDTVENMCYQRNADVAKTLNLKAVWTKVPNALSKSGFFDIQTVLSTPAYDAAITDYNALVSAEMGGELYNLNSTRETSYYNFEDPSWYMDFMNGFTLDPNKHYGMAGDFFIAVLQCANAIYMNTEYFDKSVSTAMDMSFEDFVEIIAAREFDMDFFIEMINMGWQSKSGSAEVTIDDGIGLLCHYSTYTYPFIYSSDKYFFTTDPVTGEYKLQDSPQDFSDLVEKVTEIYHTKGALANQFGDNSSPYPEEYISHFVKGNSLFMQGFTLGDLEHEKMLAMESKVAIPYPLYDLQQADYLTHISSSAELGCLLKNTPHFTACSAYFQLLNEQSVDILSRYYEYSLKFKYSTDSKAGILLDLIHDTIASSINKFLSEYMHVYSGATSGNDEPKIVFILCIMNKRNNIASKYEELRQQWSNGLELFKSEFKKMD